MMGLPAWLRSARVLTGLVVVLVILACALFAPLIAPHDPNEQNLIATFVPPVWAKGGDPVFLLGTDSLGRDVLSRLLYGARVAMLVAVFASLGAMLIGTVLAYIAGYFGGRIDALIGRAVDVWMSFPPVILSLILMVGLGTGADAALFEECGAADKSVNLLRDPVHVNRERRPPVTDEREPEFLRLAARCHSRRSFPPSLDTCQGRLSD